MSSAQLELVSRNSSVTTCTPWFFPFLDVNHRKCNPWEAIDIISYMGNIKVGENCFSICLPDCNQVFYNRKITSEPFRNCDEKNFGVSNFCNYKRQFIQPKLWSRVIISEDNLGRNFIDDDSDWWRANTILMTNLFSYLNNSYDAFEQDIAVVNVFFDKPTAIEFQNQASMDWYTYLSNVGGVLGLCIGLSIMTLFELIWLAINMCKLVLLSFKHF